MSAKRLLFASIHGYLDPSSGAALATRKLLEQLAARGWECRALACGVLDYEHETPLEEVLAAMEAPLERAEADLKRFQGPGFETVPGTVFQSQGPFFQSRVIADDPDPTYATFINPQPDKGMTVFARIALELERRRPEIPLLVVEGRGKSDGLAKLPVDLSGLGNLNRMENTPEPRDFYRVSRVVLMPSLWRESLGRVAVEAMANEIPVLASDRGALPGTLGDAGFVFTIPARYRPGNAALPTAREVAPWVAAIERIWDDPALEARHRQLAKQESQRWAPERLVERYEDLFRPMSGP